jgi:hypothetical protein
MSLLLPGTGADLMRKIRLAVLFVLFGFAHWQSTRADNYQITVDIKKTVSTTLEEVYDFHFSMGRIYFVSDPGESRLLQLVSPLGSSVEEIDSLSFDRNGLTLSELSASLLGDWTFKETIGATTNSYLLSLPDVPTDISDAKVPVITSPANGATLGKAFDLVWTNPDPNGYRILEHSNLLQPVFGRNTLKRNDPGNYTASLEDFNAFPIVVDRLNILKTLLYRGIELTRLSPSADATFTNQQVKFDIYSNTISFTIIPEPTSACLVCVTIVCAIGGRGRLSELSRLRCASPRG